MNDCDHTFKKLDKWEDPNIITYIMYCEKCLITAIITSHDIVKK